ncbi:glycoside hydrolase [Meredithblackwellia eburnea MCA 4105]
MHGRVNKAALLILAFLPTLISASFDGAKGPHHQRMMKFHEKRASEAAGSATKTASSSSTTITKAAVFTSSPVANAACASSYTGGTMITGTGTLPKPTSFVTKQVNSQQLYLDGAKYTVVGPNIYWLCNTEDSSEPVGTPTDKGRVREALAIAIRLHTCGISLGYDYAVEPTLNHWAGAQAWDIHDYTIYAAGQYGLRVILPLTDNVGRYTNLRWRNVDQGNWGYQYYLNRGIIVDYRNYVNQLTTRVNSYNGLKYSEDPTIMAWETGNELGGYIGHDGYPPFNWTTMATAQIRAMAKNQLIIDGTNGVYNYSTKAKAPGLGSLLAQIMSDHGYPRNIALLKAEVPLVAQHNKGFLLGEYDWTNSFGGDSLSSYLTYIESLGSYMGDMIWNVMGHDTQCCNYIQHNDGYSMYYPNGNTADLQANILLVVQHWYRVRGLTPPSVLNSVQCPQPVF